MKTILSNDGNVSKYLLADDKAVAVSASNIVVGDPSAPDFIIGDMNSSNATVVEGVSTPDDWFGCKYSYADSTWTAIEGWVDPRLDDGE